MIAKNNKNTLKKFWSVIMNAKILHAVLENGTKNKLNTNLKNNLSASPSCVSLSNASVHKIDGLSIAEYAAQRGWATTNRKNS